jgi:hypothetical protein
VIENAAGWPSCGESDITEISVASHPLCMARCMVQDIPVPHLPHRGQFNRVLSQHDRSLAAFWQHLTQQLRPDDCTTGYTGYYEALDLRCLRVLIFKC